MIKILNQMRDEMKLANYVWANDADPTHTSTDIVAYWDKWIRSHFKKMEKNAATFVTRNLGELRRFWLTRRDTPQKKQVLLDCDRLEYQFGLMVVNVAGLD
jgi:hypothetical protein